MALQIRSVRIISNILGIIQLANHFFDQNINMVQDAKYYFRKTAIEKIIYLVLTIAFRWSQLIFVLYVIWKKKEKNKEEKKETKDFIKECWSPGVLLISFGERSWGPVFKLWEWSCVLDPSFLRSRVPGSWSHFDIIPFLLEYLWRVVSQCCYWPRTCTCLLN